MKEYPITGETFQAPHDWRQYLRAVVAGRELPPTFNLNLKYDYAGNDRLLGQLYQELKGTGEEVKMADAALSLFEQGTCEEMLAMQKSIPYEDAPNALNRIVVLYERQRERLAACDMLDGPLWKALNRWPTEPRLLKLVKIEVENRNIAFYEKAARYFPEWFAQNISVLAPQPTGDELIWILRAPDDKKQNILDGLVAAGPAHVRSAIEKLRGHVPDFQQQVGRVMRTHPVFARALDEVKS